MADKEFRCIACDLPEGRCVCDRFCALCGLDYGARLCEDGQYYCADCHEICEYHTQDQG